jgi:uncharacterized protein
MAEILFQNPYLEEVMMDESLLIRLKPYGLSIASELGRPFLLFKDDSGNLTLPVAVSPMEAGVSLSQSNKTQTPASPHRFTEALLLSLNIKITKCVFVEIRGHYQFVRVYVENHPHEKSFKLRADEVMSLMLFLNVPIFANADYIGKSKIMSAELEGVEKGLKVNPSILERLHPYIM